MKCVAAVEVDLETSPIGTASRATQPICGVPVVTRTLQQLALSRCISEIHLLVHKEQVEACRPLVPGELTGRVGIRANQVRATPFRSLVQTARKWSLDGWRGGLGGTCSMDEYTRSDELALLACEVSADAVLCVTGSGPLIDPALADAMIEESERTADEARLTFTQAPPGLAGTVYRRELLMEMGEQHIPPGFVLNYKPDAPMMDLAFKSCCYTAPEAVRHAEGRLIADTDRALETIEAFLRSGQPVEADRVGRWLIERSEQSISPLPREVEIELTTDDQLPGALLRPRGEFVEPRGPMDLDIVRSIADELATYDDSLVVLGGLGEPLLHPQFDNVLGILKGAGVYGVAVRTNGLALDEARIESLIVQGVDVVNVILDAWRPEVYRAMQGADGLEQVKANIALLTRRRAAASQAAPLVVPELTKSVETVDELDAFFDGWVRECGWACISGYSHYAGQLPDRSVMSMAPPRRMVCRRMMRRVTVLADGTVPLCDQDFNGRYSVARIGPQTLGEIWRGGRFDELRKAHRNGDVSVMPLCSTCDEWHRP